MKWYDNLLFYSLLAIVAFAIVMALAGCSSTPPRQSIIPMWVTVGNPPQVIVIPNAYNIVPRIEGEAFANLILGEMQKQEYRAAKQRRVDTEVARRLAEKRAPAPAAPVKSTKKGK